MSIIIRKRPAIGIPKSKQGLIRMEQAVFKSIVEMAYEMSRCELINNTIKRVTQDIPLVFTESKIKKLLKSKNPIQRDNNAIFYNMRVNKRIMNCVLIWDGRNRRIFIEGIDFIRTHVSTCLITVIKDIEHYKNDENNITISLDD
jgi:hypothetical protein